MLILVTLRLYPAIKRLIPLVSNKSDPGSGVGVATVNVLCSEVDVRCPIPEKFTVKSGLLLSVSDNV
jgi:hypothetical protein